MRKGQLLIDDATLETVRVAEVARIALFAQRIWHAIRRCLRVRSWLKRLGACDRATLVAVSYILMAACSPEQMWLRMPTNSERLMSPSMQVVTEAAPPGAIGMHLLAPDVLGAPGTVAATAIGAERRSLNLLRLRGGCGSGDGGGGSEDGGGGSGDEPAIDKDEHGGDKDGLAWLCDQLPDEIPAGFPVDHSIDFEDLMSGGFGTHPDDLFPSEGDDQSDDPIDACAADKQPTGDYKRLEQQNFRAGYYDENKQFVPIRHPEEIPNLESISDSDLPSELKLTKVWTPGGHFLAFAPISRGLSAVIKDVGAEWPKAVATGKAVRAALRRPGRRAHMLGWGAPGGTAATAREHRHRRVGRRQAAVHSERLVAPGALHERQRGSVGTRETCAGSAV